jgi:hypothetical protein
VLIIPSSWGSQLGGHLHAIKQFFWRRCWGLKKKKLPHQLRTSNFSSAIAGEKEDFCKGSLSLPIFYFGRMKKKKKSKGIKEGLASVQVKQEANAQKWLYFILFHFLALPII